MGLHFSVEEFKNRKDKVIKLLKEEKLDALLMFRQESMYWLTGYDTFGYVFFQAEDGIRDYDVTGVLTCALPIYQSSRFKTGTKYL